MILKLTNDLQDAYTMSITYNTRNISFKPHTLIDYCI